MARDYKKLNSVLFKSYQVDTMRALGICMVVVGHTIGISSELEQWIFSFHMPLFFFISGLVLSDQRLGATFSNAIKHYTKRLLIPYLIFGLLTYLPWVIVTRHYGLNASFIIDPLKPLVGMVVGIGVDGWLQHNVMLWFFPCLFCVHFLYRFLDTFFGKKNVFIWSVVFAAIGFSLSLYSPIRLPWGIDIGCVALLFYSSGKRLAMFEISTELAPLKMFLFGFVCACFQFFSIFLNGRVDMNSMSFGNPLLFLLGAFSGIGVMVAFSFIIPPSRFLKKVADASILIFPLHRFLFSVTSAFLLLFVDDLYNFKMGAFGTPMYFIVAMVVPLFLLTPTKRFAPQVIGGR
jgi:fucose 4-O-acetylase-like acetyltransferase